jgi:hypothetical protein
MATPHCGAPGTERLSVAAALRRFLPVADFPASSHTHEVLRRLSRCHTGQLGWTLWNCVRCAQPHWRPSGCGDRHCPECTARAREEWIEKQRAALLPVRYYHWVFTLPAVLRPLALQNQKALYTLLFAAASETLLQFGEERFGARLGITALLHTWGQNLMEHPHLHCLVTGGGLAWREETTPIWVGPKQSRYLFPVQAVAQMFKGKFLAGLRELRRDGQLEFHGRLESWRQDAVWNRTLAASGGSKWVVFGKGSVTGPEAVLEYLGRYTHRVAISNGRLLRMDARTVTFRYKDYKQNGTLREMTLDGREFVRRLSLHILPSGFTKIRHYGILGNNRRAKLVPLAREALENSRWRMELAPVKALPKLERDASTCPHCGGKDLVCMGRLDATGHYTSLRRATSHRVLQAGWPPKISDSS